MLQLPDIFTQEQLDLLPYILIAGVVGGLVRVLLLLRLRFMDQAYKGNGSWTITVVDMLVNFMLAPVASVSIWLLATLTENNNIVILISGLAGIGSLDIIRILLASDGLSLTRGISDPALAVQLDRVEYSTELINENEFLKQILVVLDRLDNGISEVELEED